MYLENLINKVKLPFRKDKELYRRLYEILGFYPKNIDLYKQALSHKSLAIKGKDGRAQNNERLEFLGDAILDAIVGDIVYRHFDGKREGFLTNARSKIVQRETLGKLAVEMGIDKLIRYNGQNQAPHSYMAGNAFEAMVGAIYLDYGYERCMEFMKQRILARLLNIDKVAYKEVNFKSKLLEWSQKNRIRLTFEDREQRNASGNSSQFFSEVIIEGISSGTGKGFSKKEAQQNAAKDALYQLKKQKGFEESIFAAKGKRTAMEEQPQALLPEIPEELLKPTKEEKKPAKEQKQPAKEQKQPVKEQKQPAKEQQKQPVKEEKQQAAKEEKQQAAKEEKQQPAPAKQKKKPAKPKQDEAAKQETPAKQKEVAKQETPAKQKEATKQEAPKPAEAPAVQEEAAAPVQDAPVQEQEVKTEAEKKPRRRRSHHKPKTTIKPNTENTETPAV